MPEAGKSVNSPVLEFPKEDLSNVPKRELRNRILRSKRDGGEIGNWLVMHVPRASLEACVEWLDEHIRRTV